MLVCVILLIIINIIFLSYNIYRKVKIVKQSKILYNKIQQEVEEGFTEERKKELENKLLIEFANARQLAETEFRLHLSQMNEERQQLEAEIRQRELLVKQLELRKEEQEKLINEAITEKKKSVDTVVEAYRDVEMQKARTAIESDMDEQLAWADKTLEIYWEQLARSTQETEQELARVRAELDDYKKKQQAINEAILRQRAIDEQQDFYRINLSDFAIEDIKLLQEIRQKLHTSDNLNKLIYDVYVSKSVQEMVKRVLEGGAPSGIYKITRLKTGEIYIGKSTNVKDRWVQHCKTVYGAGTIAHSILHTTMAKDGLEQFTFELVEEVPKDKLTEREKYWIDFYQSKTYGLNERNG